MKDSTRILMADTFALAAHAAVGQKRKYTGEDYIVHPREVADLVRKAGGSPEMIQAALLHDVIEDTGVTIGTVRAVFGDEVATMVDELTDKSVPEDGNRAERKRIDRERLAGVSANSQTIKLADLCSNTKSIVLHDPKFAAVYLEEKAALLAVLKNGNGWLWQLANSQLDNGLKQLEITL